MAENSIKRLFEERTINVSAFAKRNDITPTTLYSILDGSTQVDRVGIRNWLKIAHGLGMTADELYEYCFVELPDDAE